MGLFRWPMLALLWLDIAGGGVSKLERTGASLAGRDLGISLSIGKT